MTTLIITGTIAVIIVIWLLSNPTGVQQVSKSLSDLYTGMVGSLVPK
jgi:hypothetical protein